jgi:hypothetical protein
MKGCPNARAYALANEGLLEYSASKAAKTFSAWSLGGKAYMSSIPSGLVLPRCNIGRSHSKVSLLKQDAEEYGLWLAIAAVFVVGFPIRCSRSYQPIAKC